MGIPEGSAVRLNLGCGRKVLDGWVNVDIAVSDKAPREPEVLSDLRAIPLHDGCADEAMAIHVIEHFYRWEVPAVLAEWLRLLKPGGLLVLECPDVLKCARNLLAGDIDSQSYWGLYGDPAHEDPFMCHRWGWTPATLRAELAAAGFRDIRETVPQWHKAGRTRRDMRLEARK